MSSRPILAPQSVITNASMTGNVTSLPTIVQTNSKVSYDISWSGTPTGTFSVQVSNTYSQNADGSIRNAGNWTSLTLSSPTAASGSSGSGFIDIDATAAYAVRLIYTASSGTGTLNATIAGKV